MADPAGRVTLVLRLVRRNLRRRAVESLLLLVALTVATSTLTIGLVLHGESAAPYARTRAATSGPDVVASVFPPSNTGVSRSALGTLAALRTAPGVTSSSGPFPVTWAGLRFGAVRTGAEIEGRAVGRPQSTSRRLLAGTWVRRGQAVVEAAFAKALGVHVGDTVRVGARAFVVGGVAVTAAFPPYPQMCTAGCILDTPTLAAGEPGLVWLTREDARRLAAPLERLTYFMDLKLRDPAAAPAFAAIHGGTSLQRPALITWKDMSTGMPSCCRTSRPWRCSAAPCWVSWPLATLVVLVGGRMSEERRRVGTFKAVGSTPGFIATVAHRVSGVALAAIGAGLLVGRFTAPLLTPPSAGLLGPPVAVPDPGRCRDGRRRRGGRHSPGHGLPSAADRPLSTVQALATPADALDADEP